MRRLLIPEVKRRYRFLKIIHKSIFYNDTLFNQIESNNIPGIVLLPENPMLIASQSILTSNDEDPIGGALISGEYLMNL